MRAFRVRVGLLLAAALVASTIVPVPVAAAVGTTMDLVANPADPEAGELTCLEATMTVTSSGAYLTGGTVAFYETTSGSPVLLDYGGWQAGWPSIAHYCFQSGLSLGNHSFSADYAEIPGMSAYDPSSDTLDNVTVGKASVIVHLDLVPETTVQANHTFEAFMTTGSNITTETGSISLYRVGVATPICTLLMNSLDAKTCVVQAPAIGSYSYIAKFSGTTSVEAADSETRPLQVVADSVEASGVGVEYTTFYPVTDGYRDTVKIKGTRNESLGVTIKIYTPGGTLIKTQTIAAGTGAYSYAWNGRTSSGTIRPAGKYKITQTLKDAFGTTKTSTFYVNLSKKKLVSTTKTITKKGSSLGAKGDSGTGSYTVSTTAGTIVLRSGSNGWAGAGYDFTLPSAPVYTSIKFRVYAKSGMGPMNGIGMQNFSECAYSSSGGWYESCFDHWNGVGNASKTTAWFSTTGSVTVNRSGTHARGMASVPAGTVTVYKAQVILVYKILQ